MAKMFQNLCPDNEKVIYEGIAVDAWSDHPSEPGGDRAVCAYLRYADLGSDTTYDGAGRAVSGARSTVRSCTSDRNAAV